MFVRILALCVAAAMITSALRTQRPEIATGVSLATGMAVLALLYREIASAPEGIGALAALFSSDEDTAATVVKAAGIAVLSELGAQLCVDAGETALAGRVTLAARVATIGLSVPMIVRMANMAREIFE